MKTVNPAAIAGAVLLLAIAAFVWLWLRRPGAVPLPGTIQTVAGGYPFALQVKERMNGTAKLTTVIIDFDRRGGQFHVPQIVYGELVKPHIVRLIEERKRKAA